MDCEAVSNGGDVIKAVAGSRPDLVVLDVNMPQLDGFEVLSALKNDQKTKSIPVVLLTARQQETDIVRGTAGLPSHDRRSGDRGRLLAERASFLCSLGVVRNSSLDERCAPGRIHAPAISIVAGCLPALLGSLCRKFWFSPAPDVLARRGTHRWCSPEARLGRHGTKRFSRFELEVLSMDNGSRRKPAHSPTGELGRGKIEELQRRPA
ncbi:MAG: hypothetical protein DMG12_19945 [Acidobacteria bacterium]|nr:MAG: hypothetical protein DMG12_19945 [Acidobacteriota bacterium]